METGILMMIVLIGIVVGCIITAAIMIWKEVKIREERALKKEQAYPLVLTGKYVTPRRMTRSAGMNLNTFLNNETGEKIDTENYLGFVVYGHDLEGRNIYHDDLVFVEKNVKIYKPGELVVMVISFGKFGEHYVIREVLEFDNDCIKFKDLFGTGSIKIDANNLVGRAVYDFTIKI
jgi:hypothetical protein